MPVTLNIVNALIVAVLDILRNSVGPSLAVISMVMTILRSLVQLMQRLDLVAYIEIIIFPAVEFASVYMVEAEVPPPQENGTANQLLRGTRRNAPVNHRGQRLQRPPPAIGHGIR